MSDFSDDFRAHESFDGHCSFGVCFLAPLSVKFCADPVSFLYWIFQFHCSWGEDVLCPMSGGWSRVVRMEETLVPRIFLILAGRFPSGIGRDG